MGLKCIKFGQKVESDSLNTTLRNTNFCRPKEQFANGYSAKPKKTRRLHGGMLAVHFLPIYCKACCQGQPRVSPKAAQVSVVHTVSAVSTPHAPAHTRRVGLSYYFCYA